MRKEKKKLAIKVKELRHYIEELGEVEGEKEKENGGKVNMLKRLNNNSTSNLNKSS